MTDCFDGWPVCWRVSRHPDKELAHGMLSDLIAEVGPTEERPLVLHSDGGAVYMTGDWASACEEGNVVRSMSRKARSGDNARAEGLCAQAHNCSNALDAIMCRVGAGRQAEGPGHPAPST